MTAVIEQKKAELLKEIICRRCLLSRNPEEFKNSKLPITNKRKDSKGYFKAVKKFRKKHNHSICYTRTINSETTKGENERHESLQEKNGEQE